MHMQVASQGPTAEFVGEGAAGVLSEHVAPQKCALHHAL